ncbi:MAG: MFS transporter [Verrucomicrobiota bacterium]
MAAGALKRLGAGARQGKAPLAILFFLQCAAMASVTVPLSNVLHAHGYSAGTITWAFCASGIAAFISPMLAGSLADRSVAPERLMAGICFSSAFFLTLTFSAVDNHWGEGWFLGLMMCYALVTAPGFSLLTTIVLSRLTDAQREFGPVRAWATWGWLTASLGISVVLHADHSTLAGYGGAAIFAVEACFCLWLKATPPAASRTPRRIRDFFGWEALQLLKHPDHRIIFLTSAVFSAVLSSFYRYSPEHLRELGDATPSATMSAAQMLEGITMMLLSVLLVRFRLKWVLFAALAGGVLRLGLMSLNGLPWLMASIALHGPVYVLYYTTSQIYLEQRVDDRLRAQSQALLSLVNSGVGNLSGYLTILWWHGICETPQGMDWPRFWLGITVVCAGLAVFFLIFYRGRKNSPPPAGAGREI